MSDFIIGVDAGTSMVKAVAFDAEGRSAGLARQAVKISRPAPGHSEQGLDEVWDAVVTTVREVSDKLQDPVRLLAVTAQGDGCWFVDADGAPTAPAILWNDARATSHVEHWQYEGVLDEAFRISGSVSFPGAQSAILRWLGDNAPELLDRSDTVFYCKDWLRLKLTGERATDESDASLPFLDVRERQYSPDLLNLFELEAAERLLPEVAPRYAPSELTADAGEALGLPAGLPVVIAPFDIAATAIGMGVVEPGQAVTILGTTLCSEVVADSVETDGEPAGMHVCSGVPQRWLRAFASMAGTDALDWLASVTEFEDPAALARGAGELEPGAAGIALLPYLSPAGERAPFLNPHARGMLFGFSLEHGPNHLARAWLEGLTFVIRDCLSASAQPPTELRVCGGGAASEDWCQMIADSTRLPVTTAVEEEVGAKGAAVVGLSAVDGEDLANLAGGLFEARHTFQPQPAQSERYDEAFDAWRELRTRIESMWR